MFDFAPHPDAFTAEAFTCGELDVHPERGRIWATIEEARQAVHEEYPDEDEKAQAISDELDEEREKGYSKAYNEILETFDGMEIDHKIDDSGKISFSHHMVASTEDDERLLDFLSEKLGNLADRLNDEYEF